MSHFALIGSFSKLLPLQFHAVSLIQF